VNKPLRIIGTVKDPCPQGVEFALCDGDHFQTFHVTGAEWNSNQRHLVIRRGITLAVEAANAGWGQAWSADEAQFQTIIADCEHVMRCYEATHGAEGRIAKKLAQQGEE
jgi:hypothetical protein